MSSNPKFTHKIFKYPLLGLLNVIELPKGAKVVHAEVTMGEGGHIWAIVNSTTKETELRGFAIVGTGHPIPPDVRHILTWRERQFVWHLLEQDVPEV